MAGLKIMQPFFSTSCLFRNTFMKKRLLLIVFLSLAKISFSQIPNPDFETWVLTTEWEVLNGWQSLYSDLVPPCISKDTESYSGNYAVRFNNNAIPSFAYTSFPISSNPIALKAFVKAKVASGDSILIRVVLYHSSQPVDSGRWVGTSNLDNYTETTIPISNNNPAADSALIDIRGGSNANTEMLVDELAFDYSSNVPGEPAAGTFSVSASSNPFRDFLQLNINSSSDAGISLKLTDVRGVTVLHIHNLQIQRGMNTIFIPAKNFANGIYECIVYGEGKFAVINLLKIK